MAGMFGMRQEPVEKKKEKEAACRCYTFENPLSYFDCPSRSSSCLENFKNGCMAAGEIVCNRSSIPIPTSKKKK